MVRRSQNDYSTTPCRWRTTSFGVGLSTVRDMASCLSRGRWQELTALLGERLTGPSLMAYTYSISVIPHPALSPNICTWAPIPTTPKTGTPLGTTTKLTGHIAHKAIPTTKPILILPQVQGIGTAVPAAARTPSVHLWGQSSHLEN